LPRPHYGLLVLPRLDRFPYKVKRELGRSDLHTEIQIENTYLRTTSPGVVNFTTKPDFVRLNRELHGTTPFLLCW